MLNIQNGRVLFRFHWWFLLNPVPDLYIILPIPLPNLPYKEQCAFINIFHPKTLFFLAHQPLDIHIIFVYFDYVQDIEKSIE